MTRIRPLMVVILILGLPKSLLAMNPQTQLSQYAHTAWRLQDGLLSSVPHAITQTKDGYLWLFTDTDVLRFDGLRFTSFGDITGQQLPRGRTQALYGSSDGSLWIGIESSIYRWQGSTLSRYALPNGRVYTIKEDSNHVIWIGRGHLSDDGSGACRITGADISCLKNSFGQAFAAVGSIAAEPGGAVWFKSVTAIARYEAGKIDLTQIRALSKEAGLSTEGDLSLDPHGGIWIGFHYAGSGLGLEHFQGGRFHKIQTTRFDSSLLRVVSTFTDRDGTLWVGTSDAGLLRIRGSRVEKYDESDGLSGNTVSHILQDQEGSIWMITNRGIDRFADQSVITYSTRQHLSSDETEAVLADRDGRIWATHPSGVDILGNDSVSRLNERLRLSGTHGTSVLQDHSGGIWLGMDNGLYHLTKGVMEPALQKNGAPVGLVGYMVEDKAGIIWISTFGQPQLNLLYILPGQRVAHPFANKLAISKGTLADVHSGIWILDRSNTLAHIDNGQIEIVAGSALRGRNPQSVFQSADGTVYVWCLDGVVLIRGSEARAIRAADIGSCRIYASTIDKMGSMWAAGLCGLFQIDEKSLNRMWESPETAPVIKRWLDVGDGFSGSWPDFSPSVSEAPDGRLWFANNIGIQEIDPTHLAVNYTVPPVKIESLTADHRKICISPSLALPPRTHDLEIDYTALSFINTQKLVFRYKLDEYDTDWQDAGTRREAFYTNLPPGYYRFRVKARNASGVWNEQGASVAFTIAPMWYQTLWLRTVAITAAIGFFVSLYLLRIRTVAKTIELRVSARMSERLRISRELHDTVLQALQGLVLSFSTLTTRVEPEVRLDMERFLDDAELLTVRGRDRIKEMRGYFPANADITTEIHAIASGICGEHQCQVTIKTNGESAPLTAIVHDDALWIAREALRNACQHAQAKNLNIEVSFTPSEFRLLIQDDGVGLEPDAFLAPQRGHFGLASMRERADLIGGRLNVYSARGRGTAITLMLPARIAYVTPQSWFRRLWSRRFN